MKISMRNNLGTIGNTIQGGGFELIWTNPNPNVAFDTQIITLDKAYKGYIVIGKKNTTDTRELTSFVRSNPSLNSYGAFEAGDGSSAYERTFRVITNEENKIEFNWCNKWGSGTRENNWCIPLRIYATNKEIG